MALIDVVKWEINTSELVHKFPIEDLKMGSQLIVYPGQAAIFIAGGQIVQKYDSGTYTLDTANIPLLNKIYNIPFGGTSPFQAEVWFINLVTLLDLKWGTPSPIQIEDPKYNIIVPVRAHGQYGIKINQPLLFFEKLTGNMPNFTTNQISAYFRPVIISKLNSLINKKIYSDNLSIVNINTYADDFSQISEELLVNVFQKYGIHLAYFSIASINVDESDPSFVKLKEIKESIAKINIMGRENYQMERSFDVLEVAAGNESGSIVGSAVGLGAGLNIGNQIGNMAYQYVMTNPISPYNVNQSDANIASNNISYKGQQTQSEMYHIAYNGNKIGPICYDNVIELIDTDQIDGTAKIWKRGLRNWMLIVDSPEFSHLFPTAPPPIA